MNTEKPSRVFLLEVRLIYFNLFMGLKSYFMVEIMHSNTLQGGHLPLINGVISPPINGRK